MRSMRAMVTAAALLASFLPAQDRCGFRYAPSVRIMAYHLTPEQERMFQTGDWNQLSPFWHVWDAVPFFQQVTLNCIEHWSYGPEDCRQNTSDAQITLRAAWGDKGVYLCFTVLDEDFSAVLPGREQWAHFYDVIVLYVDRSSASELYSDLNLFLDPSLSQLSYTTNLFEVPLGVSQPGPFTLNWILPYTPMDEWRTWPGDWIYRMGELSFADAQKKFCISLDVVNRSPGCRALELLIPWDRWGCGYNYGGVKQGYGSKPIEGNALAMTFGYNDKDDISDEPPSAIRWRNQDDPWMRSMDDCQDPSQTIDSWGEILFGQSLSSVLQAAGALDFTDETIGLYYNAMRVTVEEDANQIYDRDSSKVPSCRQIPVGAGRFRRFLPDRRSGLLSVREWYSITGRRMQDARRSAGVVIERAEHGGSEIRTLFASRAEPKW